MKHYRIFLSGPSDVANHIESARTLIHKVNLLSEPLGVQFDGFDWLESVTPAVGVEPQSVINAQAKGYSAIIAVLGARIGTPTNGYESGTVEEVEIALGNLDALPFGGSSVMVFFKSSILDIRTADLSEAAKIQALRKSLGPRGVLYKDFSDDEDFERSLLRCFGVLLGRHFAHNPDVELEQADDIRSASVPTDDEESEDDFGILDLDESVGEKLRSSADRLHAISAALSNATEIMNRKTSEIDGAIATDNKAEIKKIISAVARAFDDVSGKIEENSAEIRTDFFDASEKIRRIIEIQIADISGDAADSNIEELAGSIVSLSEGIEEARSGMQSYSTSVTRLPRLTKDMNVAKRRLLAATASYAVTLDAVQTEAAALRDFLEARRKR